MRRRADIWSIVERFGMKPTCCGRLQLRITGSERPSRTRFKIKHNNAWTHSSGSTLASFQLIRHEEGIAERSMAFQFSQAGPKQQKRKTFVEAGVFTFGNVIISFESFWISTASCSHY